MAKRRLTKRQQNRIATHQRKANAAVKALDIDESNLEAEQTGFVVAHFGTQVLVQSSANFTNRQRCHLRANSETLVVGDNVRWQPGESSGVVNARLPRHNALERPGHRGIPKAVVANIEVLAIVFTSAPPAHRNLIDRYLVAAHHYDMTPLLVANKAELPAEKREEIVQICHDYRALGYNVIEVSTKADIGIDALKAAIKNKNLMLAGQSGVGKSSLTNILVPDANMQVGELSHAADKGKHTTTASHWFAMDCGGGLIDSPGIREFGIMHLTPNAVVNGFIECVDHTHNCRFRDCDHKQTQGCAVQQAYTDGLISKERYASFHHLFQEASEDTNDNKR